MTPAAVRPLSTKAPAPAASMRWAGVAPRTPSALTTLRFVTTRGEWTFDCDAAPDPARPGRQPAR